jgi:hypothetical protein
MIKQFKNITLLNQIITLKDLNAGNVFILDSSYEDTDVLYIKTNEQDSNLITVVDLLNGDVVFFHPDKPVIACLVHELKYEEA